MKLIVAMGAVCLAAWMGASWWSLAVVTAGPSMAEGPEHADAHRLGWAAPEKHMVLPAPRGEEDPLNLFCLLTTGG